MSLHWDPGLENNKPWTHTKIAWHSDLQWCITIPRFGFKKLINLEDILQNRTDSLKFWTFNCDLDHKCSNPIFSQDSSAYDDLPSNYVWIQKKKNTKNNNNNPFCDVLLCFTLSVYSCLCCVEVLVLFIVELQWPKRQIFILCIYYE